MSGTEMTMEPRGQHYLFAHRLLPQLFFRNPAGVLGVLGEPDAVDRVSELWELAGRGLGGEHRVPFEGVSVTPTRLASGLPIAIVVLPAPRRMCEAFMIGLAAPLSDDTAVAPRFFTLELGLDLATEQPRTVMCEWRADGSHQNWGDGPEPSLAAFVAAASNR